jgi:hypothetical protein
MITKDVSLLQTAVPTLGSKGGYLKGLRNASNDTYEVGNERGHRNF